MPKILLAAPSLFYHILAPGNNHVPEVRNRREAWNSVHTPNGTLTHSTTARDLEKLAALLDC